MAGSDQANLNGLLKWGIENSESSRQTGTESKDPRSGLDAKVLAQLLGGPSDADLMREAMRVITAPQEESPLDNKLIAWDNLEQLVEQIDNANNLQALGLWKPLIGQLKSDEADCRMYAAWVISTAVQNNVKCQEILLSNGAVQILLDLALNDSTQSVRKKAATALSSEVRNYQPALDEVLQKLPNNIFSGSRRLDANDMEEVNSVITPLREQAARN